MNERPPGSQVAKIILAGSRVLTIGKLVNPREHVDIPLILSWEFGAYGHISGVDWPAGQLLT